MKYIKVTPKEHLIATLRVLAIIGIAVALALLAGACNPKSSINNMKQEKVVVLGTTKYLTTNNYKGNVRTVPMYSIKVKRIDKGVVTYITTQYVYAVGDTILHSFAQTY